MIAVDVSPDAAEMGRRAGTKGAAVIRAALARRGTARIVLATGVSQFSVLDTLLSLPGIDWSKVTAFHLDEYVGLPPGHPASFRRYLRERFVARAGGVTFVPVNGDAEPADEIARLGRLTGAAPIDLCFAGLGENGHLAFNDPPADFETDAAFLLVTLAEASRRQQLGQGWFGRLDEVPRTALSMSIRQIMRSATVIAAAAEARKAAAVRDLLTRPVSPQHPGTILREHGDAYLFLDTAAAALLAGPR